MADDDYRPISVDPTRANYTLADIYKLRASRWDLHLSIMVILVLKSIEKVKGPKNRKREDVQKSPDLPQGHSCTASMNKSQP